MSQPKSDDNERSGDHRQSLQSPSHSVGRQTLPPDLDSEVYGTLVGHVSSMPSFLSKTKKVAPPPPAKIPLPPTVEANSEHTIEKETKSLLQKVDTLVSVMEKMTIGPSSVDNYRYEAINKELQEINKMATKKELSLDPLSNFQVNSFNQKLQAVELEIRDIYTSWIEYYSATLHEVFQQCLILYKRMSMLKKKNKKQKLLLHNITEFSSYAAAQKSSLYKLIHASYQALPAVTSIDEIYERISSLETMLNTPLPISFGNVPRPSVGVSEKKQKTKTDKNKKQETEKKGKSKDKAQVKFQEAEGREKEKNKNKHKDREAKKSNAPPVSQTGDQSMGMTANDGSSVHNMLLLTHWNF